MILDASVAIALRSPSDPHASRAAELILAAEDLVIHPVTLAECLVAPARSGSVAEARRLLVEGIGIRVWAPGEDEPERVADVRAAARVALPDCYPLLLAADLGLPLATFDAALAAAARERGLDVVP